MAAGQAGLTPLGKFISFILIVGLAGIGGYVYLQQSKQAKNPQPSVSPGGPPSTAPAVPAPSGGLPQGQQPKPAPASNPAAPAKPGAQPSSPGAQPAGESGSEEKLAATLFEVPKLLPSAPYQPKNNVVDIELSEWAGYAGLIAANGGLAPNDNSWFAKNAGFKAKITISEEDSWSSLNGGQIAVSATTVDVLAVYGKQFKVTVPIQLDFSRGADGIVVRSDIKRINDLKGKILIAAQFNESDFFIRYLAREANIPVQMLKSTSDTPNPDAVNLVYAEDAFAAGDAFLADITSGGNRLAGCITWAPKTTEVAEKSAGKANVLATNRNLLVIADILIVNKGFADQNPKMVAGLVEGILEGNRMVRETPDAHLDVIAKAFKWDRAKAKQELDKVHLSNLPENLAFFSGAIDAAGSFGGIFQSAVYAYGKTLIKDSPEADRFLDLKHLKALQAAGKFANQKVDIAPIRGASGPSVERDPLLSKDIRFFFEPNSAVLDQKNEENIQNLASIKNLLQVSPGSSVLLRGHVDDKQVAEFRKKGGESFVRQMALKAMELSQNRAGEIKRLLIEKHQVDPKRIETLGRGWEEPVSTNSDQNRRVEVQWFTLEN